MAPKQRKSGIGRVPHEKHRRHLPLSHLRSITHSAAVRTQTRHTQQPSRFCSAPTFSELFLIFPSRRDPRRTERLLSGMQYPRNEPMLKKKQEIKQLRVIMGRESCFVERCARKGTAEQNASPISRTGARAFAEKTNEETNKRKKERNKRRESLTTPQSSAVRLKIRTRSVLF